MRSRISRALLEMAVAVFLVMSAGGNIAAGAWQLPGWMPLWLAWVIVVADVLPLLLRRFWPLPAYITGVVLTGLSVPVGGPVVGIATIATGCALYFVATQYAPDKGRNALVAGLVVLGAFVVVLPQPSRTATVIVSLTALAGAFALGRSMRIRREQGEKLRDTHAEQAVAQERLRIAREMHDVVAHSMSLIAVKAAVGNHVAAEQPEEARAALRVIEDTSRETLAELRRMLGVLRSEAGTPEADLAPAPSVDDLRALAERTELAGIAVTLDVDGLAGLPAGVGQSVYRITQEALTNVVKHAGARTCRVGITGGTEDIRIEIRDDGVAAGPVLPGHGLIGMRERVAVYAGEFSAEPLPDGGFRVFARLPYQEVTR